MKKITNSSTRFKQDIKSVIIFFFFFVFSYSVKSQVFWQENFNNGCTSSCDAASYVGVNGAWTTFLGPTSLAAAFPNKWYVSCAENGHTNGVCGSGCVAGSATATLATLHIGSTTAGDMGAAYDAGGCGGGCTDSDIRAQSPTINCSGLSGITLAFNYITLGAPGSDFCTVEYSINNGATWLSLTVPATTALCGVQGRWTSFSIALPATCNNNPTVKIGFHWINNDDGVGTDPSFAVDDITLSAPLTNSITTGPIAGSPFCACTTINVPFTATGAYLAGNVFTAQISDASGSFVTPSATATLVGTTSGTISITLPCFLPTGSNFLVQVNSSAPAVTGSIAGPITITNLSAAFTYLPPYCQNDPNPLPIFIGTGVAGTFTSSPGLVLVSTSTGEIDLAASNVGGPFTITNSVPAAGGCPAATATANVTINAAQNSSFNYSASSYCNGSANPTPTITGVAGGTFSATPAGLVFVSTSTGQINLLASAPATYTVTYALSSGLCPSSSSVSVTISSGAPATFSYTGTPYCTSAANPLPTFSGGGVAGTFSSTAGLVFVNTSTGEVNIGASTPGTYTVTNSIAASGGCAATSATSTITISTSQNASFSYSSPSYCQAGTNPSPTITGTTGGTFSVAPAGLVFVSNSTGQINLAASSLGSYNVTYTTPGPCAAQSTISVDIVNASVATFSYTGTPYCSNNANPVPTYSGGGVAGTFSSTAGLVFVGGGTAGQVDLLASTPGTYTVTNSIASFGGCPAVSATSTIVINTAQDSSFNYSATSFCQTGTNPIPNITGTPSGIFSSTAGLVFVNTSTGEIDLAASTAATYNVTYTTPGPNCVSSLTVSVTISAAPVATFSYAASPYCQNGTDPSPTFSGGGTAGAFTATPGGLVFISTSTGQVDLSASLPATYTVTNTVSSSGICPPAVATATITITAASTGNFNYIGNPYCQNGINPVPNFAPGSIAGTFTAPAGLSIVGATGAVNLSTSTPGTYVVTNTIAASGACPATTYTANITIASAPVATFSYSPMSYCQNAANPSPVFSGGGTAGTFTSTTGLSVNSSSGLITLLASSPGTYVVTNTIAATAGCAAVSDTSTIIIHSNPTVTVTSPAVCQGMQATITASGAVSYSWSAGATSSGTNTATASPAATTSYTVTGTAFGCTGTAVSTVTVTNCNLDPDFKADKKTFCLSGCANFTDLSTGSPTGWQWLFPGGSPSSSTSSGPINVCYSAVGDYTVILVISNITGSDSIVKPDYIHVVDPIPVTITGNTTINSCEGTELTAQPAGKSYLWGPNVAIECNTCQTATVSPTVTQQYYVTYTDMNGCTDSDTTLVTVTNIFSYFMPTGFSPNGDGINDVLYVKGRGIDYIDLKIFDRIGEQVFQTTSIENGWDGTLRGLGMNDNSFVYKLTVTYCTGEQVKENGTLTLVR